MKISLWKNSAPPVMKKKSLASEITSGRGQSHHVFLAGIISENYKFAKMSTR